MNANVKRRIKGVAKTAGKYTLKGLGKGLELTGRGVIKTVDTIVKNPQLQKIVTGAGILAASVMVPAVGVGLITALGIKYMIDNSVMGGHKDILDEINETLGAGNKITKSVSNRVLRPILRKADRGMKKLGKGYQDKIDDIFEK